MVSVFLDDIRPAPKGFLRTYTVRETIALIKELQAEGDVIDVLSLDNDLGEGESEGYKVLDWLEEEFFTDGSFVLPNRIVVHSSNPSARMRMEMVIDRLYDR